MQRANFVPVSALTTRVQRVPPPAFPTSESKNKQNTNKFNYTIDKAAFLTQSGRGSQHIKIPNEADWQLPPFVLA